MATNQTSEAKRSDERSGSHTPGPWSVDKNTGLDVRGPDGKDVCVALCQEMGGMLFDSKTIGPEDRQQAFDNALLIAAAPELLEALKNLSRFVFDNELTTPGTMAIMHAADAAIAKAEGKCEHGFGPHDCMLEFCENYVKAVRS